MSGPTTTRKRPDRVDAAANWLGALPAADSAGMSVLLAGMMRTAAWNVHMAEAMLQATRHVIDVSHAVLRQQQDATLRAWREQIEAVSLDADQPEMLAPFAAATKAAVEMSSAMLQAQRNALQAFSEQSRSL